MRNVISGALVVAALIVAEASYARWRLVGGLEVSDGYVTLHAGNEIWGYALTSLIVVTMGILVIWGLRASWRWKILRDTRNDPPIWAEHAGKIFWTFRWEELDRSQTQRALSLRIAAMQVIRWVVLLVLGLATVGASLVIVSGQFLPIHAELGIDHPDVVNSRVSLFPKSVDRRSIDLKDLEWIEYDRKDHTLILVNRDESRLDPLIGLMSIQMWLPRLRRAWRNRWNRFTDFQSP